jgi:hypothetical protein
MTEASFFAKTDDDQTIANRESPWLWLGLAEAGLVVGGAAPNSACMAAAHLLHTNKAALCIIPSIHRRSRFSRFSLTERHSTWCPLYPALERVSRSTPSIDRLARFDW